MRAKADLSAVTSRIEDTFSSLRKQQILIPRPDEVRGYLIDYPDLIDPLVSVCGIGRAHFATPIQLSLELYRDPEIDDQYLTLYVRQQDYDDSLLDEIDKVCEERRPLLEGIDGHLLVTTDFAPVE
jgi:hypothetical protein